MAFPAQRPRRLRQTAALRRLVQGTRLHPAELVLPVFVKEGLAEPEPIGSMPGIVQHSLASLVLAAKEAGLPVVLGLEVDYCRGRMEAMADLLAQYPFDVLLGSIHWLDTWMFDVVESPVQMAHWDVRGVEATWRAYAGWCRSSLKPISTTIRSW